MLTLLPYNGRFNPFSVGKRVENPHDGKSGGYVNDDTVTIILLFIFCYSQTKYHLIAADIRNY